MSSRVFLFELAYNAVRLRIACLLALVLILLGAQQTLAEGPVSLTVDTEAATGFCDTFSSPPLNPGWAWVDPIGDCSYSLTSHPEALKVHAPLGTWHWFEGEGMPNVPRAVQELQGDFGNHQGGSHRDRGVGPVGWHHRLARRR